MVDKRACALFVNAMEDEPQHHLFLIPKTFRGSASSSFRGHHNMQTLEAPHNSLGQASRRVGAIVMRNLIELQGFHAQPNILCHFSRFPAHFVRKP